MPTIDTASPFAALASELVADQLTANPVLGSSLGLVEHDEALPDMSAGAGRGRVDPTAGGARRR
jgi:hypothetical protein